MSAARTLLLAILLGIVWIGFYRVIDTLDNIQRDLDMIVDRTVPP